MRRLITLRSTLARSLSNGVPWMISAAIMITLLALMKFCSVEQWVAPSRFWVPTLQLIIVLATITHVAALFGMACLICAKLFGKRS